MRSSLTRPMMIGLLLCLVYYAYACWISYGQLYNHFAFWMVILFGSGFAGVELSVWLMLPFSKGVKSAMGFLLGVNGAISAVGWIFLRFQTREGLPLSSLFYIQSMNTRRPTLEKL